MPLTHSRHTLTPRADEYEPRVQSTLSVIRIVALRRQVLARDTVNAGGAAAYGDESLHCNFGIQVVTSALKANSGRRSNCHCQLP